VSRWVGAAAALVASVLVGCAAGQAVRRAVVGSPTGDQQVARAVDAAPALTRSGSATPKPEPPPNACARNTAPQLVLVSISKQHAWLCARTRTVYSTAVTTGMTGQYTATPTGTYRIQGRDRDTVLTLNSGATYDVKYWIPFDAPLFGFHDSSWQSFPYGSARYRTEGSHGCIHLPLAGMKFLYDWGHVGATVVIRA
jgi:lipoprotein-anchoring transpeptidase ErfK/SrfK